MTLPNIGTTSNRILPLSARQDVRIEYVRQANPVSGRRRGTLSSPPPHARCLTRVRAKSQKFGNLRLFGGAAPTFLTQILAERFLADVRRKLAVETRVLRAIERIAAGWISA
jgi:hypothetical protein